MMRLPLHSLLLVAIGSVSAFAQNPIHRKDIASARTHLSGQIKILKANQKLSLSRLHELALLEYDTNLSASVSSSLFIFGTTLLSAVLFKKLGMISRPYSGELVIEMDSVLAASGGFLFGHLLDSVISGFPRLEAEGIRENLSRHPRLPWALEKRIRDKFLPPRSDELMPALRELERTFAFAHEKISEEVQKALAAYPEGYWGRLMNGLHLGSHDQAYISIMVAETEAHLNLSLLESRTYLAYFKELSTILQTLDKRK